MDLKASDVLSTPWVQALRPRGQPYLGRLSKHSDLEVWHVDVEFRLWPIPAERESRWKDDKFNNNETWRKRPLLVGEDSGCRPFSCGEVELAARLRHADLNAKWVSEWSTYQHVDCWHQYCVKRSELEDDEPELWAADNNLRMKSGNRADQLKKRGGHPDVAAWRSQADIVYVEYKGPNDSVSQKQDLWAQELLRQHPSRFCYVAAYGRITTAA
jgi:hypothetical protein